VIKPKKSLGQNFLIDQNIINIIINSGTIKNRSVLEIGPGTGNLTKAILSEKPKKLFVIEKDDTLSSLLLKSFNNEIVIINKDILRFDENTLADEKLVVFGNLPYNISTEILCKWIINLKNNDFWFDELILMFQKEVADRIIAKFNSSNYSRLTILANWKLNVKKICDIDPDCFFPKPKINSTLLYFSPKRDFFKINDAKNLEKITRIFFNHRRKMIKKPFNQIFNGNAKILDKLKIDLNLRPQNLDLMTYYNLTKEYEDLRS
jgi:16S rRNA (adenine1518-N6/adenine1519-N6)-dimethyltransferase